MKVPAYTKSMNKTIKEVIATSYTNKLTTLYLFASTNIISSKPKHPRYNKGVAKSLKGLVEKDVKSKWAAKASCF